MSFTGSSLTAEAVRGYSRSRKDAEEERQRRFEAEQEVELGKLRQAFLDREVPPEALDRVAALVRRSVDMGERQALVLRFPSSWLPDEGRAITDRERNWPASLDGFARRAYDFLRRELEPRGFQIRAEIVDWPGGMPGQIGFFLTWKSPDEA